MYTHFLELHNHGFAGVVKHGPQSDGELLDEGSQLTIGKQGGYCSSWLLTKPSTMKSVQSFNSGQDNFFKKLNGC